MLVLLIGIVFQACVSIGSLFVLKQSLITNRTNEVKHLLDVAYATVSFYHDEAAHGRMSDAAAREAARKAIRAMHYDGKNYYFIWAMDGTGIANGAYPEFEGRRFMNSPDATKHPVIANLVSRLVAVAKSKAHEGVSTYRIYKAGGTTPIDKITYSKLFAPWGWSIGTGAYVDDISTTFRDKAISLLVLFSGLLGIASLLTFMLGRDLTVALRQLSARLASVAAGELDGEVPAIERRDEVGVMARALLVLRDKSKEAIALALDQLTGLPSRKLLTDRLKQAMAAGSRSGNYCGLLFLDLDKFKALNDSKGHDIGDMLLREVAQRLRACVRESDTVARLGGDEFVVVVTDIGEAEHEAAAVMEAIAAKVLALLNQTFYLGTITHKTTGSIGLTVFRGDAVSVEDVLKQADLAMYKAKESGRNACRFFDPYMEAMVRERTALEADLLVAIAEGQFQLHYQAQIGRDGRPKGAEALIRWHHPERGLVAPADFIPFAEETGLILPVGRWVLEAACRQLVAWAADPELSQLKIAVNVSTRQFQQADFVQQILATIEQTGADPKLLELELTESLLVDDVDDVIDKMHALRSHGVSFALDDFGTGYSSLSYLKHMPFDQLKIDRTFVRDLLIDPNDATIAKTIVAFAHALGLRVIAEGVESAEQCDVLASFGCDDYQGFYFSVPLPVNAFEVFARGSADLTISV